MIRREWFRRIGANDGAASIARTPLEGIRRAKQRNTPDAKGIGKVHGCGIDSSEEPGAGNEGGQLDEIGLAGEVDAGNLERGLDGGEVGLLGGIGGPGEDGREAVAGTKELDNLCPAIRLPVFLRARRAGMNDGVSSLDIVIFQLGAHLGVDELGDVQLQRTFSTLIPRGRSRSVW